MAVIGFVMAALKCPHLAGPHSFHSYGQRLTSLAGLHWRSN